MTDPTDFIPAGYSYDDKAWLGRKASTAPLPASFIKAAVAQGTLVPPHTGVGSSVWSRVICWFLALGVIPVCVVLAVIYGTKV